MATTFRPPRQWVLTEEESINSFANWQSNLKYYLSLNDEFAPYLTSNWQKSSVANHGLADDAEGANAKTAVQNQSAEAQWVSKKGKAPDGGEVTAA